MESEHVSHCQIDLNQLLKRCTAKGLQSVTHTLAL